MVDGGNREKETCVLSKSIKKAFKENTVVKKKKKLNCTVVENSEKENCQLNE